MSVQQLIECDLPLITQLILPGILERTTSHDYWRALVVKRFPRLCTLVTSRAKLDWIE